MEIWHSGKVSRLVADVARCDGCPDDANCPINQLRKSIQRLGGAAFDLGKLAKEAGLESETGYIKLDQKPKGQTYLFRCNTNGQGNSSGSVNITIEDLKQ